MDPSRSSQELRFFLLGRELVFRHGDYRGGEEAHVVKDDGCFGTNLKLGG